MNASKELALAINKTVGCVTAADERLAKALDAYAEHIASRVMAHLRGEADLDGFCEHCGASNQPRVGQGRCSKCSHRG